MSYFVSSKKLGKVLLAGVPMYINDDTPAREPDIMVVLNKNIERIKRNRIEGPADIAMEIVSPGSERADRADKLVEYEMIGVPEYWLIDPIRKEAVVYVLSNVGHYHPQPLDASLRLQSAVLKGFVLDPAILWRDELPEGIDMIPIAQALLQPDS